MFIVEVGCSDGRVYDTFYLKGDFDYVLKDVSKLIKKIDWTTVEDIMIRKEDENG